MDEFEVPEEVRALLRQAAEAWAAAGLPFAEPGGYATTRNQFLWAAEDVVWPLLPEGAR